MACTVEANGTTLTCACNGCGISYNHSTKKYHILCCGSITEMSSRFDPGDPDDRPPPGHIDVDINGATLLEAMQLIDRSAPGKLRVEGSFAELGKTVKLKGRNTVEHLGRELHASSPQHQRG